jgi:hypothetical protein
MPLALTHKLIDYGSGIGGSEMRILIAFSAAALCAGCVTTESVQFQPTTDQRAIVRDGQPALVSERKNSLVMVRPAARQFQIGGRPVFVLAIYNRTSAPEDFRVANVQVTQIVHGEAANLRVITYEKLVEEEKARQTFAAIANQINKRYTCCCQSAHEPASRLFCSITVAHGHLPSLTVDTPKGISTNYFSAGLHSAKPSAHMMT